VLLLGGLVSLAGAVLALWLVRARDLVREADEPVDEEPALDLAA
jgi:hypothetical protein